MNYSYEQYQYDQFGAKEEGKPVAGLVLGICSMIAWILPIVGLPVSIAGLVVGVKALRREGNGMAVAATALSATGLVLSIANAALGAYLGATGQLY
jgi:hypothetical protein